MALSTLLSGFTGGEFLALGCTLPISLFYGCHTLPGGKPACSVCPQLCKLLGTSLQPGNSHSNCQAKPFAFISQTRGDGSVAHLLCLPAFPKQGAGRCCTKPRHHPTPAEAPSLRAPLLLPEGRGHKGSETASACTSRPWEQCWGHRGGHREGESCKGSRGENGQPFVKEGKSKHLAGGMEQGGPNKERVSARLLHVPVMPALTLPLLSPRHHKGTQVLKAVTPHPQRRMRKLLASGSRSMPRFPLVTPSPQGLCCCSTPGTCPSRRSAHRPLQAALASAPRAQRPETCSYPVICLRNYTPITSSSLRQELPEWLLACNASGPTRSVSHLSKTSCCITISGSRRSNKQHPRKKRIRKPNVQSLQRRVWERDGKYKALT